MTRLIFRRDCEKVMFSRNAVRSPIICPSKDFLVKLMRGRNSSCLRCWAYHLPRSDLKMAIWRGGFQRVESCALKLIVLCFSSLPQAIEHPMLKNASKSRWKIFSLITSICTWSTSPSVPSKARMWTQFSPMGRSVLTTKQTTWPPGRWVASPTGCAYLEELDVRSLMKFRYF